MSLNVCSHVFCKFGYFKLKFSGSGFRFRIIYEINYKLNMGVTLLRQIELIGYLTDSG
jgi:hypothetical protein